MKTQTFPLLIYCAALGLAIAHSPGARADNTGNFPHPVPFDMGRTRLAAGDSITIQSVRGTAEGFRTNETYCVEGTYTLSSRDEAEIALFVTSKQDAGTKIDPRQVQRVKKGRGTFRLIKMMNTEGNPHVSLYPVSGGGDFGGVYFGKGDWLWAGDDGGQKPPADPVSAEGANRALLNYLGEPVDAPADLDPAYRPAAMRETVQTAAAAAGIALGRIEIDDTEFPYLVWVTGDEAAFAKLKAQFGKMGRYEYYGSVGGDRAQDFTIIPARAWPAEARQRIYRRATLRMQVLYDRMSAERLKQLTN